jgi:hypothetical protein
MYKLNNSDITQKSIQYYTFQIIHEDLFNQLYNVVRNGEWVANKQKCDILKKYEILN